MTIKTEQTLLDQVRAASEATRAALLRERDIILAALVQAQAQAELATKAEIAAPKPSKSYSKSYWAIGSPQVSFEQRQLLRAIQGAMERAPGRNLMQILKDLQIHEEHSDETLTRLFFAYERYAVAQ
jgi:hypothetical protein